MVISNNTINVVHNIAKGDVGVYTSNLIHLEVTTSDGVTSTLHSPVVVAQTSTTAGSITFSAVSLSSGSNRVRMFLASNADLDVANSLTKLGSGYIRVVDATATEILV